MEHKGNRKLTPKDKAQELRKSFYSITVCKLDSVDCAICTTNEILRTDISDEMRDYFNLVLVELETMR